MTKFIDRIFGTKVEVDLVRLALESRISFESAQVDKLLLRDYAIADRLNDLAAFQQDLLALNSESKWSLEQELNMLKQYVEFVQNVKGEDFFVQFNTKVVDQNAQIQSLILFPLIQNAIKNGYASMEKFPIKIRISGSEGSLLLEVSNRVNHYVENQGEDELIQFYRKRLQWIYADKHELFVNSNSQTFKATLFLKYDSND